MNKKIDAIVWGVTYVRSISIDPFIARIEWMDNEVSCSKNKRFATYSAAYQWIHEQIIKPKIVSG